MKRVLALLALGALVAGCEMAPLGLDSSVRPTERPGAAFGPRTLDPELVTYFRLLENDLKVRGLMRTDGGTVDAPYTDRQLAENFVQIALFREYTDRILLEPAPPTASVLERWRLPVRVALVPGPSVTAAQRLRQQAQATTYVSRLAQVTGHPVSLVAPGRENFTVYTVTETERRAMGPVLRDRVRNISDDAVRLITDLPREVSCLMVAFSVDDGPVYYRAIAIIRAELPQATWRSCLHEEVAQGLGLPNDSPRARPSIFNDDEEFALLTGHDELLLSILYDPRLTPGMSAAQATPIVRRIAAEKLNAGPV